MSWADTREEHAGAGAVKKSYEVLRELPDKPVSERISKLKGQDADAELKRPEPSGKHTLSGWHWCFCASNRSAFCAFLLSLHLLFSLARRCVTACYCPLQMLA
jgi:hypothetical protein